MADSKISALTAHTSPIDTDLVPIVDVTSGITKKITKADLSKNWTKITFNNTPSLTPAQGDLYWNVDEKTLSLVVDSTNGVTLDIGHENFVIAVNKTGSQINDGQVVYLSTPQGNRSTAVLARSDAYSSSRVIGVATQNIADNAEGKITVQGVVHGFNTSSFSGGDTLYLSSSSAGTLTTTAPSSPNFIVAVAVALNSTANGSIYVQPHYPLSTDTALTANSDLYAPTQKAIKTYVDTKDKVFPVDINRQGFLNLTETSISFATTTFTLTDNGSGWSYYRAGLKYTISGNKTVALSAATAGIYYIYIDSTDGTLTCSAVDTPWTLLDTKVPVATLVYNSTLTPTYWLADERHTALLDQRMSYYIHATLGTKAVSLPTLSGYTLNSDVNANKTFAITSSTILDQDLKHDLASLTQPNGTNTDYSVWYRTGASTWVWTDSSMAYPYSATYIQYDNAGTLTTGISGRFYNSYLLLTNKSGKARHILVPGRSEFTSLASAQAESVSSFTWTGFPIDEAVIAYRLTWQTNAAYTSSGKCRLAATPQQVNVSSVTNISSGAGTDHNTLSNLQGGTVPNEFYHQTAADRGFTTTATAAGTTTLTVDSNYLQFFTGTTTQTVVLPDVTTLSLGRQWYITNNSTGAVTINTSGGNTLGVMAANTRVLLTVIALTGTDTTSWSYWYTGAQFASGKTLTVNNSLTITGTDGETINVTTPTAGKILVGDGTNMVLSTPTYPNASATSGKVIQSDGTNFVASTNAITIGASASVSGSNTGDNAANSSALALTGGTMTGAITLGENTSVALDPALSADEKWTGITRTGLAKGALAIGDLIVPTDTSNTRWELADANVITAAAGDARGMIGICLTTASSAGDAINILLNGVIASAAFPNFTTLNAPLYISETAGDITLTQPTTADVCIRVMGFSLSATELYFNPSPDYIIHV